MRYKNDSNSVKLLPSDDVTVSYVHGPFITGKVLWDGGDILILLLEGWMQHADYLCYAC